MPILNNVGMSLYNISDGGSCTYMAVVVVASYVVVAVVYLQIVNTVGFDPLQLALAVILYHKGV